MLLTIGVGVRVEGNGDGRVTDSLLNDFWIDAGAEREGGPGVAKVVQADSR
jgi:hypothetical protein